MKALITLKNIIYLVIGIVVLVLIVRGCNACKKMNGGKTNTDTISHKIDTVWLPQTKDTVYVPEIIGVTNTIHHTKWVHDTLERFEIRIDPADTAAILKRYYQTVAYSDTQNIQYGKVIISDTVTQNRIKSRGIKVSQSIPIVKETTVLRTPERTQIWIGANTMTDLKQVYAGAELMLKTKGNIAYSGGVMLGQDGKPLYTGGVKILIRLKKQK